MALFSLQMDSIFYVIIELQICRGEGVMASPRDFKAEVKAKSEKEKTEVREAREQLAAQSSFLDIVKMEIRHLPFKLGDQAYKKMEEIIKLTGNYKNTNLTVSQQYEAVITLANQGNKKNGGRDLSLLTDVSEIKGITARYRLYYIVATAANAALKSPRQRVTLLKTLGLHLLLPGSIYTQSKAPVGQRVPREAKESHPDKAGMFSSRVARRGSSDAPEPTVSEPKAKERRRTPSGDKSDGD